MPLNLWSRKASSSRKTAFPPHVPPVLKLTTGSVLAVVDAEKYKRGESVRHTSRLENPSALLDLEFSGRP
jgi:hypothetical protein